MKLATVKHEPSHALGNLLAGARSVRIVTVGRDGAETHPEWEDPATVGERVVAVGFLAGQLAAEGVDTSHDQLLIRALPAELAEEAWKFYLEEVRPALDAVPDSELVRMRNALLKDGAIRLQLTEKTLH